ncbi:MAG: phosphopantetheine-binding protein [Thermoanaerobaculia bacterium]|nr:phosphopantetheine-binding protein [Thermoanaerobaculia bacterium]
MSDVLLQQLANIAHRELDYQGPLERSQRLVEDLRLDSLQLLTLATAVEDHFLICLDEDDESSIATVDDLLRLVQRKVLRREHDP